MTQDPVIMKARRTQIAQAVIFQLAEHYDIEAKIIREDQSFDDLGADSLDVVEHILWAELQYEIELNDDHTERAKKVGDLIDIIATEVERQVP